MSCLALLSLSHLVLGSFASSCLSSDTDVHPHPTPTATPRLVDFLKSLYDQRTQNARIKTFCRFAGLAPEAKDGLGEDAVRFYTHAYDLLQQKHPSKIMIENYDDNYVYATIECTKKAVYSIFDTHTDEEIHKIIVSAETKCQRIRL